MRIAILATVVVAVLWAAPAVAGDANPCAGKNPCNPCAAKDAKKATNPCNPCNPCAAKKKAANPCNPCGAKKGVNPCNPCGGGAKIDPGRFQQPKGAELASGTSSELVKRGEELWSDAGLGRSGLACASCHVDRYTLMKDGFDAPYPHYVEMPSQRAGVSEVSAAEMVQFCMIVPMADDPLPWDSRELAALTAWVERIQTGFDPSRN
jgi:cytochrome c